MFFNGTDNPQKLLIPLRVSGPHIIMVSRAHSTHPANGISIGSATGAGFTNVTDRQTDRQTNRHTDLGTPSVAIGCYR